MGFLAVGILSVAFWKKALSNSGDSEKSISESRMVPRRSQSVSDCFFEFVAFISRCLSYRYYSNLISVIVFGESHNGDDTFQKSDANPSFLAVVFAPVYTGEHREVEHFDGILKCNPVLRYIGSILRLIPKEFHTQYIHCVYTQVKWIWKNLLNLLVLAKTITCGSAASCTGNYSRPPIRSSEGSPSGNRPPTTAWWLGWHLGPNGRSTGGTQGIRQLRTPHVLSCPAGSTCRCSSVTTSPCSERWLP